MEKRVVLLVILCVVVFVGWTWLMKALYPPAPPAPPAPQQVQKPQDKPADPPPPPEIPKEPQHDEPEVITPLANERVTLVLTNRGAGIRSATVKVPNQADMPLLKPFDTVPHLAISAEGSGDDTARAGWKVTAGIPNESVTYEYPLRNGLVLEKKLELKPGAIEVEMVVRVKKGDAKGPTTVHLRMIALTGLAHDSDYRYDYYGHGFVSTVSVGSRAIQSVAYGAPAPLPRFEGDLHPPVVHRVELPEAERKTRIIEWFGLRNRYAAVALVSKNMVSTPEDKDQGWIRRVDFWPRPQEASDKSGMLKGLSVEADLRDITVKEKTHQFEFALVLAPIRAEDLKAIPDGKGYLLSYGCWGLFNIIGEVILLFLGWVYSIVGNYGWAIILTTLVIRGAMFPLTRKSQVSMSRMAELQPKMNAIRERYADDPQKNQQETMKLFKEHGVNPLAGCLPILMQLPVFIGLYSVLDISLEFRQAPFLGWITDLSQPDRLVDFKRPIDLWIISIPDFNIVPIVMTVTWFLQAYFAPRPKDPKLVPQQRMMMIMPVVMGLFCYSLASGLSLYLFVNSLLAMIEQKIVKKYFLPAKAAAAPPGKA